MVLQENMQVKVLTLRFCKLTETFNDTALQAFIKDKEVISIRDHFFEQLGIPYLTLVVIYRLSPVADAVSPGSSEKVKPDESWKELLTEAEMPLFNTLRNWRNERAKRDGIPPYIILTNRQLAVIVKARPESVAQLGEIEGIGTAKLEHYGKEIASLLSSRQPATTPAPEKEVQPNEPE